MKNKTALGVVLLLITAFVWGLAFVAQSVGGEAIGGFTFSTARMLLGGVALLPVALTKFLLDRKKSQDKPSVVRLYKLSVIKGLLLGVVFCIACNFQQFAFVYSSAGKVAFITAMYMLFVPFICIFLKQKVAFMNWLAVGLGIVGIFFLCIDFSSFDGINTGDLLALCGAVFFGIHIVMIDRFGKDTDGITLATSQFLVGGAISLVPMLIFELPVSFEAMGDAIIPILYAGICSCGIAYTFQILGQKYVESTFASIIMSTESVFAVIFSAIILKEQMTPFEILGCVIMFIAILTPQVYDLIKARKKR
ncbi:MAG: DMT family transporter [Clostridia bacterium]|nr:DMT family transporter [Clostridia bacterium]